MIMAKKRVPREAEVGEAEPAAEVGEAESAAEIAATVEAILFAADKPLPPAKISEIGQLGGARAVRKAVEDLNGRYERTGASFRVLEIADGYQMQTLPEYSDVLSRLAGSRRESRLSQAALETVAIVAYRQPALRADVEAIRGVACGEVLRGLMDKGLIRIVGRADEIGRPLLYGTTKHFLEVFGLASLNDLPDSEQLRKRPEPADTGQDDEQVASEDPQEDDDGEQADEEGPPPARQDENVATESA